MTDESKGLLIVVPCFHESARLPSFLDDLCRQGPPSSDVSILVVDDGSSPDEWERLQRLVMEKREEYPQVREPVRLSQNIGKGGTVYAGWSKHEGEEWLAFVDADGSCPAHEVRRLSELALRQESNADALFASRVLMLGRDVERKWSRHLIGRVYATLVSDLLKIPVYDSQCGLKFVRRSSFESIRDRLHITGFAFDVELLTMLLDAGYVVQEHPIDWHEVAGGKVHLVRDSIRMLRDVLRIKKSRGEACHKDASGIALDKNRDHS